MPKTSEELSLCPSWGCAQLTSQPQLDWGMRVEGEGGLGRPPRGLVGLPGMGPGSLSCDPAHAAPQTSS